MSRSIFSARPAVFLFLTCCLAWSTALADPPAVYLAEGNAIDPTTPPPAPGPPVTATTTTTTTTTTLPALAPACVPVDCPVWESSDVFYACSCHLCCPGNPSTCTEVDTFDALKIAHDMGCTWAPNNHCSECDSGVPPPLPPPSSTCLWVAAWDWTYINGTAQSFKYSSTKAVPPSCFANRWGPVCKDRLIETEDETEQWWGLCRSDPTLDGLGAFLGDPLLTQATRTKDPINNALELDYWYMDANCHWATPAAASEICGFAGIAWSPISLIWEDDASLDDGMTVVSFSIDARQPDAFSLWKASEKTPLLVYDPTHSAKVASAKQLFGSYTFGGKTTKVADYRSEDVRTPWGNGYEALALLDSNHDGKLSGKELKSLALWFDKNRDGVSQSGEVKSLSALGVTALYYKPDRTDPQSGNIQADLGYERRVHGKLVKGASVDWFAQTFSTRQEATAALSAIFHQEKKTSDAAADELGDALPPLKIGRKTLSSSLLIGPRTIKRI